MTGPHVRVAVCGTLVGCPLVADVTSEGGSLSWEGRLQIQGKTLHGLLHCVDAELSDPLLASLLGELVGPVSATIDVAHGDGMFEFSLDVDPVTLWALRRKNGSAFAIEMGAPNEPSPSGSSELAKLLKDVGGLKTRLRLPDLLLAYRRGDLSIRDISRGRATCIAPRRLSTSNWLLIGRYDFERELGGTTAGHAITKLFGKIAELDLVAGLDASAGTFTVCLAIPLVETKYITVTGLHILVSAGAGAPTFEFRGGFRFPLLKNLTLEASCSFGPSAFLLAAEIEAPQSFEIPFLQAVSFDNAALLIGFAGGGLTFGFFGTLYIRAFLVFGAVIVNMEGNVPAPMLVSGAVGRLSIPSLYENFTGRTLDGLGALDMVALDGIDFAFHERFDMGLFARGQKDEIASFFNEQIHHEPSLALSAEGIQIRQHVGGYALVDRLRMRHYFVDASGAVSLRAQFYFSWAPGRIELGSFSASPGIFLCGTIEVFERKFAALLSIREREGILVYARLDPFDLGHVLRISASQSATPSPFSLARGDLVGGLVPAKTDGLVFYLSASAREVTFFFDGRVELLDLFVVDAKVVYIAKRISIHVETTVFGVHTMVALDASYEDFLSASFHARFSVDTKALTEGLGVVTKRIDKAISALTKATADAKRSLDEAQAHVNELRGELDALDARIKKCKDAIKSASKIKRPFVLIAKTAEIAAYEVAKAGIWTAMKVATAALSLAKKAVAVFANLGADVLELINTTIRAASSLLFLRHVEISAEIDRSRQVFEIDVAFVALGKTYTYQKSVRRDVLGKGILPFLEDKLLGLLKDDLDGLEQGRPPSRPRALASPAAAAAPEAVPDIDHASAEILRTSRLFGWMQARYRKSFHEDLSDFEDLRTSFFAALDVADNALGTAKQCADPAHLDKLSDAIRGRDQSELSSRDREVLEAALTEVDLASKLHDRAAATSDVMATARENAELPPLQTKRAAVSFGLEPQPVSELDLLKEMQEEIRRTYEEGANTGYVDLSREPSLDHYFAEARAALGGTADEVRTRTVPFTSTPDGAPPYRPRF